MARKHSRTQPFFTITNTIIILIIVHLSLVKDFSYETCVRARGKEHVGVRMCAEFAGVDARFANRH